MKKTLLASCILVGIASIKANAIELKVPTAANIGSSTSQKNAQQTAANEAYIKAYQKKLAEQKKALDGVVNYDLQARLNLANVILDSQKINEIKNLKGEEKDLKLNEYLVSELTNEEFPLTYIQYEDAKKTAYLDAITKIEITNNRYKNVSNQLTAPLKQIVDGNVSAISAKEELKNAAGMILGIKKDIGANSAVRKAVHKATRTINKANRQEGGGDVITVVIPDTERVIYPKDGVIGSINAQMDEINYKVQGANKVLTNTLLTKEQIDSLKAIQNNSELSAEEKATEGKKLANSYIQENNTDGTISKRLSELTPAQKEQYTKASQTITEAVGEYGALAVVCTKLGFNIYKNPLIAAPLVFEVGALKDSAALLKTSASDLGKSLSQIKKINSANNIVVEKKKSTDNAGKIKSVGFKNLTK